MGLYSSYQDRLLDDKELYSYIASYRHAKFVGERKVINSLFVAIMGVYGFSILEIERYANALNSLLVNRKSKIKRLRSKIESWLKKGFVSFLTITWNDDTLKNLSFEDRKKLVYSNLKSSCFDFVANIDFGDLRGREHYHAIVLNCFNDTFVNLQEKYGFVKIELVNRSSSKLCEYLDKLTNHAMKESSSFGKSLMYCRRKKKKIELTQESIDLLDFLINE